MVLCAGLGTRLRPLTEFVPKPACPVLNRPLVAYNFALLAGLGVRTVAINVHHLAERMTEVARSEAAALHLGLHVSTEPVLLGTGGGLKAAEAWLAGDTFVLLNGDFVFDVDLPAALATHRRHGATATLVVQPMPAGESYRPLHARPDGTLACLPGHPAPSGAQPWHFTGVHLLQPAIFAGLRSEPSGIFETGYRHLLASGARVQVHEDRGSWRDIGSPAQLLAANLDAGAGLLPLARFSALGPLRALSPEADVGGLVEASVVGPDALVPTGAQVRHSLVFAGTRLLPHENLDGIVAAGSLRLSARHRA